MTSRPYIIGVTGNIACGKTLVLDVLKEFGAETIDADRVYHELVQPGTPLLTALHDRFGNGIMRADGSLDRTALGRVVFADPQALADLDALTHPAIVAEIRCRLADSNADTIAVDAVKLIESGLDRDCDAVWVVRCEAETAIARLMERNGMSKQDAVSRVVAQPSIVEKLERADAVIDNSGTRDATREQVTKAWHTRADRCS